MILWLSRSARHLRKVPLEDAGNADQLHPDQLLIAVRILLQGDDHPEQLVDRLLVLRRK